MTEDTYSPEKLKLRQEVLKILMSKYGHENNNRAIYECADEWVNKYVISAGVVDYYNAYKQSFINKSLEL
jgi:CTP:phosphocholine cytidylyltransferase-like protein